MPRRALVLGCLIALGVLAGCGGEDPSADSDVAAAQVEVSNTSAGRFPEEELVRAQDEAAAAEAELAAVEEPAAPPEPAPPAVSEPPAPVAPPEPAPAAAEPPNEESGDPAAAEDPPVIEGVSGIPAGSIKPGRYTSATFEPHFTLEFEAGWLSFQAELEDFVALSPANDLDLTISFLSPKLATALIDEEGQYTDQNPTDEQLLDPLAFDYFDWVHAHPHYESGDVRNELLAGRAVSSFDATLTSGYRWQECLGDCVLLVAASDGELLAQAVGYRERLYTTEVADLTFVVSIAAPEAKFDSFVPRAVELLSTLELVADAEQEAPIEAPEPADELPSEAPAPPAVEPAPPVSEPAPSPQPVAPPPPAEPPAPPEEPEEAEEPERLPPAPLES